MRKIKFRYVYRNFDTDEIKTEIKDITQIEKDSEPYLDRWVLISREEFTGLVDRNGKEIYEGDILETEQGIAYVIWNDAAFALKSPGSNAIDWEHSSVYEKSIVIGSIHDNPELLNEKQ